MPPTAPLTFTASLGGEPLFDPGVGLLIGLLLVVLNGFFVAAEFALAKVRPTQIESGAETGERRARLALHMLRHLDSYLSATQLGITLASIALGWVGEPAFAWMLEPLVSRIPGASPTLLHSISLTAAFATVSVLHIVFGELVPKSIAIRLPRGTALWTAAPLYVFYWAMFPAIWLLNRVANAILRLIGIRPVGEHEIAHSEEEVRLLLASRHGAELPEDKRDLLENVFELFDRVARQVMVPRADVVFLSTTRTIEENLDTARVSGHTRFPLCEGDLDSIVGVVHIKDLFRAPQLPDDLRRIARPVRFVPASTPLDKLMTRMRGERLHLAAVLDEYGGVSGIVTLENVIEEIVGPIQDEFDAEKPELVERGEGVWQVSGAMLVMDLEDELGLELSDRDEDTVAGLVLSELGRRPRPGDRVETAGFAFEVLEVQGHRIRTLRLTRLVSPADAAVD
ncbi:MAG: HlyC/CorC family transporter [Thermoanaerobaculia bacterium]|nr:MAG: HlyC/CorC family transporter [Thermoanaerobaculia bacterium]MBZ0101129.1 hemolysin family protein [Thermoanaerobaculia bacterium]